MDKTIDYIFKIILIGDSGVGKTSLMTRFTDKKYDTSLLSTIGVDFKIKTIIIDKSTVKLQIWDTAGQERFRAVVSNYYRGAHGIFVVFDILNHDSFLHLKDWFGELSRKNATETAEIMVLANKIDESKVRKVTEEEIHDFLLENQIPQCNYLEVSAKDNIGVEECFIELTKKLISRFGNTNINRSIKGNLGTSLNKSKKSCC